LSIQRYAGLFIWQREISEEGSTVLFPEKLLPDRARQASFDIGTFVPFYVLLVIADIVEQFVDQLAGAFIGLPAIEQLGLELADQGILVIGQALEVPDLFFQSPDGLLFEIDFPFEIKPDLFQSLMD
jgi:hypothetical protein